MPSAVIPSAHSYPALRLWAQEGTITAKLTLSANVTRVVKLLGNQRISYKGYWLYGKGFLTQPGSTIHDDIVGKAPERVPPYRNGRDLNQRPRGVHVINLFGMTETEVRKAFLRTWSHLFSTIKPIRDQADITAYRELRWVFAIP